MYKSSWMFNQHNITVVKGVIFTSMVPGVQHPAGAQWLAAAGLHLRPSRFLLQVFGGKGWGHGSWWICAMYLFAIWNCSNLIVSCVFHVVLIFHGFSFSTVGFSFSNFRRTTIPWNPETLSSLGSGGTVGSVLATAVAYHSSVQSFKKKAVKNPKKDFWPLPTENIRVF